MNPFQEQDKKLFRKSGKIDYQNKYAR